MISKHDILKFIRHVHRRGQGIPDRRSIHPRREWLIGLSVFLIVTGVGAVLSMITFENYKNIDKRAYEAELALPTYNEARANTVLSDFAARKQRYSTLIGAIQVINLPAEAVVATTTSSTTVPILEEIIGEIATTTAATTSDSIFEE